jgi:hypothetical protein
MLCGDGCRFACSPAGVQVPLPSHTGRLLVEDQHTAEELYQIAKGASDARDFAARLQRAGLMAGSSSSSSAGEKGGGSKGSTAVQPAGGGSKLHVPLLSKTLAHQHARDGIIIVTWANYHFFDFVLNWVRSGAAAAGVAAAPAAVPLPRCWCKAGAARPLPVRLALPDSPLRLCTPIRGAGRVRLGGQNACSVSANESLSVSGAG